MGLISRKRQINQAGFTFIELVIGVTILGILALIAIRGTFSYLKEASQNVTKTNLKIVKDEVMHYHRIVHQYPQSLKDLVRKPADIQTERQWGGPYFGSKDEPAEVPTDGWNNEFVYKLIPEGHPPFKLYSWGENGPGSPEDEWVTP